MTIRGRIERLEQRAAVRSNVEPKPVEEMSDAELIAVVRRACPWVSDPPTDAELAEVLRLAAEKFPAGLEVGAD